MAIVGLVDSAWVMLPSLLYDEDFCKLLSLVIFVDFDLRLLLRLGSVLEFLDGLLELDLSLDCFCSAFNRSARVSASSSNNISAFGLEVSEVASTM